jgi:hypothetical protein
MKSTDSGLEDRLNGGVQFERYLAIFIAYFNAQLTEFEDTDVATHALVVIGHRRLNLADGPRNNDGKFTILAKERQR